MIIQIAVGVLVVIAVLLIVISMRPAAFRIERSAQISAPAPVVFALLNDFRQWVKWSPWEKLDPRMQKTFSGPDTGVGASYAWVGNSKAGEGSMTVLDSQPNERLCIQLRFIKPFAATNQSTFELRPSASGTEVRWIMEGQNGFAAKAFSLFVNMDQFLGKDFEEGLAKLNTATQIEG
jgi:uncharacterized protein YndB with AHSA1/START domain